MKWVMIRVGNYKLVEDNDPRPEIDLPSKPGAPAVSFTPSWKKHEAAIHLGNADQQYEASDKFIAERAHEMRRDPQAKRWEESRKKSLAKDKPAWRKEKMKNDPLLGTT